MNDRTRTIYVKSWTYGTKVEFALAHEPSDASRSPTYRIGGYWLKERSLRSCLRIARAMSDNVVLCDQIDMRA
jgi:hypothetical protein